MREEFPSKSFYDWKMSDKRVEYAKSQGFDLRKSLLECDHIHAIKMGGHPFSHDNLQTLCQKCHKKKTKTDMKYIHQMLMICKGIREYWNSKKQEEKMSKYWEKIMSSK